MRNIFGRSVDDYAHIRNAKSKGVALATPSLDRFEFAPRRELQNDVSLLIGDNMTEIEREIMEVLYEEAPISAYAPLAGEGLNPGATSVRQHIQDIQGEARWIDASGSNMTGTTMNARAVDVTLGLIGVRAEWTFEGLRNAAMFGAALDATSIRTGVRVTVNKLKGVIFNGDGSTTNPGIINIPTGTGANQAGTSAVAGGTWDNSSKTGEQIVADIGRVISAIQSDTRSLLNIAELVCFLPSKAYDVLSQKTMSATGNTVITHIMQNDPWQAATQRAGSRGFRLRFERLHELTDTAVFAIMHRDIFRYYVVFGPQPVAAQTVDLSVRVPIETKAAHWPLFLQPKGIHKLTGIAS